MDIFDNIVVLVGCVLIVIGLVLFIIGKKESTNSNHVEGFGIKLNVSNPSIILIVLGVGLLLAPRLLPKPELQQSIQASKQNETEKNQQLLTKGLSSQAPSTQEQVESREQVKTALPPPNEQAAQQAVKPLQAVSPKVFFPSGLWQLTDYQENGINLSANVSASLMFTKQSSVLYLWSSEFDFVDNWGNLLRYQYQGTTFFSGGAYYISFLSSTDPNFVGQNKIPLELKLENGGQLHMKYFFNNSEILLHWQQSF